MIKVDPKDTRVLVFPRIGLHGVGVNPQLTVASRDGDGRSFEGRNK